MKRVSSRASCPGCVLLDSVYSWIMWLLSHNCHQGKQAQAVTAECMNTVLPCAAVQQTMLIPEPKTFTAVTVDTQNPLNELCNFSFIVFFSQVPKRPQQRFNSLIRLGWTEKNMLKSIILWEDHHQPYNNGSVSTRNIRNILLAQLSIT